jgi:thiamine pyrophosphate-dependent acetolactate synthase large subunit-like protein
MNHGGKQVAEQLFQQGVRSLFTLCGGHISPILAGCKAVGIDVVDVRDEASAVFAADASSRMTGIPGVAAVTAGPGVTNSLTALQNALLAQSPLILLGGASATVLRGRGSLQDIDQLAVIRPHVKMAVSVKKVRDIQPLLAEAFKIAMQGVPGPVFIELPIDLLYPEAIVREWYGIKGSEQAVGGLVKKAIGFYLNYHANRMFREAEDKASLPVEPAAMASSTGHIGKAGQLSMAVLATRALKKAKRPVMVVGSQTVRSPVAVRQVIAVIDALNVPVYLSGMARGLLGKDHPLQFRHARRKTLREADLVILSGVPCDFRLDYGNHINRHATLIALNLSREDLLRNRVPSLPVWGDPAIFLSELARHCGDWRFQGPAWIATLALRDAQREDEINTLASGNGQLVNPLKLLKEIDACMADDAVIVADGGDFVATASYTLRPRGPLRWLDPGVFGTLGVGGGFALGAAAALPGAEIWLIYGDGSSAYSLAEIDTFVRKGFSMIVVIGNDGRWNQIARDQVNLLGDDVGVVLRRSDYHRVAEGYGGVGILLNNNADIGRVLGEARTLARQGKPVVINALLDASDFRQGSISV